METYLIKSAKTSNQQCQRVIKKSKAPNNRGFLFCKYFSIIVSSIDL